MNRYAQPLYGKIVYIFETELPFEKLSTIFDPSTYWIDVTNVDCEVGYLVKFVEGIGITFEKPTEVTEEDKLKAEATQELYSLKEKVIKYGMATMRGEDATFIVNEYNNELLSISNDVALFIIEVFPIWSGNGIKYKKGQRVQYNGVLYEVVKEHVSQENWKPDITPSEYSKVISSVNGEIPEWEQPLATNAYQFGDKVKHNGKYYESTYRGDNVWEPGTVGEEIWKDITDEVNNGQ